MPKRKICDENAIVDIISRSPQAQGILQHFSDSRKREKVILWVMKNNKLAGYARQYGQQVLHGQSAQEGWHPHFAWPQPHGSGQDPTSHAH
jgi:hypothetical protein